MVVYMTLHRLYSFRSWYGCINRETTHFISPGTLLSTILCVKYTANSWLFFRDKTPLVQSRNSFNAWASGEPNDADGSEDCVAVDIAYKHRRWSDLPCYTEIGYICQYPSLI